MKRYLLPLLVFAILFLGNSCSNDFDLNAPYKDVPVIYGLLSKQDTAQYFRIEKAFIDESTSALELAQRPDSLYYENAVVRLEEYTSNDVLVKSFNLTRVDGNLEGYPREAGVFATAPNYLYKLKLPANETLVDGATYKIILERGDGLPTITAETVLISDMSILQPGEGSPFNWASGTRTQQVIWRFDEEEAFFFDIRMRIRYQESLPNEPTNFVDKTLMWTIDQNIENEDMTTEIRTTFVSGEFFNFLGQNLDASLPVNRRLRGLDIIVDAGGEDLFEYINVGRVNTGITSSQIIPTYTNVTDGFGVFSSKSSVESIDHILNGAALDSLRNGQQTADLNFQ